MKRKPRELFFFSLYSVFLQRETFYNSAILFSPVTKYRCVFTLHPNFLHIYEALRKLTIENVFGSDVDTDRV